MKVLVLAFLLVCEALLAKDFRRICPQLLLAQGFIKSFIHGVEFQRHLLPVDSVSLKDLNWPFKNQAELDALAKKFVFPKISLSLEVHSYFHEPNPHVVVLLTFFNPSKTPVGYLGCLIKKNRKGEPEVYLHGFYLDPHAIETQGISAYTHDFTDREIYKKIGIKKEMLQADYIGRYVWAKQGYDFNPSRYFWTGRKFESPTLKPLAMVRQNFLRFLKYHHLSLTDLVIRSKTKQKKVESINDMETSSDFAHVFHRTGKKIKIAPLIAENTLGEPAYMPIGKAFMLSDHRPEPGESYICSPMGTRLSNRAMPKWYGVRYIASESSLD